MTNTAKQTDPVVSAEFRTRLTIFNADVHVSFHIKNDGSGQARLVVMPLDRVGGATYNMPANVQKLILHEISYRFMSYEGQEEASFDGIKEWLDSYDQLEKLQ